MDKNKTILEEIEKQELKNREVAQSLQQKKLGVYRELSAECIKEILKFRDELKKSAKIFHGVNQRIAELESLYPGYLSFLQKSDNLGDGFDPAEVRYLIDYLLTSKWRKDAYFWHVIDQITDTINVSGNPFKEVGDG
jgi:hypothetical protein